MVNTSCGVCTHQSLGRDHGSKTAGPPEHYACPGCFEDRKIYPLQDKRAVSGDHVCPGCGKSFPVDSWQHARVFRRTGRERSQ
jgi:hypothetical protein